MKWLQLSTLLTIQICALAFPAAMARANQATATNPGAAGDDTQIEVISPEQDGDHPYPQLPARILASLPKEDPDCDYVGREISLTGSKSHLWLAAASKFQCMGSGGGLITLVLEKIGQPPTIVLDSGTVLEVDIDKSRMVNGLPQIALVEGGNCCGISTKTLAFDGDAYRETSEGTWEGDLEHAIDTLGGSPITGDLRSTIKELATRKDCTEGMAYADANRGLQLVGSLCEGPQGSVIWIVKGGKVIAREAGIYDAVLTRVKIRYNTRASSAEVTFSDDTDSVTWHITGSSARRTKP